MSQNALRRLGCQACQNNVLQSFVALAGVSLPHLPPRQLSRILPPQRRPLSQTCKVRQETAQGTPAQATTISNEASETIPEDDVAAESAPQQEAAASSVPWYLQVPSSTAPSTNPISSRQTLPELPENSPPILSPLMTYLFDTAGLDDLSLVDLRHLDPPPALGSNLIMIMGSARSIKHLNVSADRFCRWLRSEYKLRPFADGLLGRNELKIKLRRRAKRAKLASSVGRQLDDTNRDDGITTGWVCINVGAVPSAEGEDEATTSEVALESNEHGFVGFGTRETGSRIVVQMFTEEKRAELDLEGLWDHRRTRRSQREERLAEDVEAELVQDLEHAFDKERPRNAMEEMTPPPEELTNYNPIR